MKNFLKNDHPYEFSNNLSNEAAYEIHIFLSNFSWNFLNQYYDKISQYEQEISFMKENNPNTFRIELEEDDLPY